jgi:hypothetical protein
MMLQPLRIPRKGNTKRDRQAALQLKAEETLYWAGQDGTVAKLTIETPEETENIVNLELIDDLVRQVSCPAADTEDPLKVSFAEEADFNDADDIWQWVNQQTENHFLLLVGAGTCGWNTERIVYNVTGLAYNDEAETALLQAKQTTWKQAAHTFDLTVGNAAVPPAARRRRSPGIFDDIGNAFQEGVDKVGDAVDKVTDKVGDAVDKVGDAVGDINADPSFTIPLASDLGAKSISLTLPNTLPGGGGTTISATCVTCATTGNLQVQAHFAARLTELTAAALEVSLPEPLTATAVLALTLTGEIIQPVSRSLPLFEVAPGGVTIPGVLTIGPTLSISVGMDVGGLKGSVAATMGGKASVAGGSKATLDFLDEQRMGKEGWDVEFGDEQFKVDAAVETGAGVFLRGSIGVEVSVLETGFRAEVKADAPTLKASLKAVASTNCTVCGEFQTGVQGSLNFGTVIGAGLTRRIAGTDTPLWSLNFAEANTPAIASFCQGFGPKGEECLANALIA